MTKHTLVYLISKDMVTRRHVAAILCSYNGVSFSACEDPRMAPLSQPDLVLVDEGLVLTKQDISDLRARFWGSRISLMTTRFDGAAVAKYAGVDDMLAKPISALRVMQSIAKASAEGVRASFGLLESLTSRERQVLDLIVNGSSNKEVGRLLAISPRTVEVHRQRVMQKTGARNAVDLTRIVLAVGG